MKSFFAFACLLLAVLLIHAQTASSISSLDDLPYDSANHLASHILAYTSTCTDIFNDEDDLRDELKYHIFIMLEGQASTNTFGHLPTFTSECIVACIEKATPKSVVARPMPHRYWINGKVNVDGDGNIEEMSLSDFVRGDGCGQVEYGMLNFLDRDLYLYWVNDDGSKVFAETLHPDDDGFITTYIGHKFEVYDSLPNENGLDNELLEQFTIENYGVTSFGIMEQGQFPEDQVASKVEETVHEEWSRHLRIKRTFSSLGFDKGRLPDDVFASLAAYYHNNQYPPHVTREEWESSDGIFVNYWESDILFVQMPPRLKKRWQSRLKKLVEEWVGVELETTDIYGFRVYSEGARLATHVDRESTHAASLIVNVAQEDVTRPWTIEVNDHADRLHEVVMEPGDIVYYESAKALHGRNTPLQSGKYINLFSHYRPLDDPEWFLRDNPEGTPEPLIDVGECKLVGRMDQYSQGAVKCDNDAVGPHLSPALFRAKSGADLFRWWEMVGTKIKAIEYPKGDKVRDEL